MPARERIGALWQRGFGGRGAESLPAPAEPPAPPEPAAPAEPLAPADPVATVDPVAAAMARDGLDSLNMRRLIAFLLREDSCAIDVGAHRGAVLAEMLRVAPRGRHLAFEPIPALAEHLAATFPGVEVRCAALADEAGETSFAHVHGDAEGWSGLRFRPLPGGATAEVEEIQVRLERLDDVIDPERPIALMKIDVEGAELGVLRGAARTLERHRPVLIFEHGSGSAETYGTAPADVHALLTGEFGMRIFDLDGSGPYDLGEFERVFYAAERVNFVAHP